MISSPSSNSTHTASRSSTWRQLSLVLGDRRGAITVLTVGSVLAGITESGILAILAQVAVALVDDGSRVQLAIGPLQSRPTIGVLLTVAFGMALARLGLQAVLSIVPARIAADLQAKLRTEVFASFTHASWGVQSHDREGHLQETLTNQIGEATSGAMQATTFITAFFTFLILVISALALNAIAALTVCATAVGLFALLRPLNSLGSRRAQALSAAYMNYASGVNEAVGLAEEAQVFGTGTAQRDYIGQLLGKIRYYYYQTQVLGRLVQGIYQSLIYLLVVVALTGLFIASAGQVASLGAVVLLLVRAGTYGQQAQAAYQLLGQTLPYLERVQDAQQRYLASSGSNGTQPLDQVRTLAFENVSFAYDDGEQVLSSISFEAACGEAIGIIGPSGAGKSTLVQILLRLRAPGSGRYLVNGTPADRFANRDWHRHIAYVPQEPRLLHATVAENIRFFRADIDNNAVQHAAQLAGIHDDVMAWANGYETLIGPRANAVSGGQQQRICLARALAAQPEVVILDEPTSALDPHSELLIQRSLDAVKHQLTLFIVAHRMSTLSICERVMVVIDGNLNGFASQSRLGNDNAYYRSASELQSL